MHVAAVDPAKLGEAAAKRAFPGLRLRIGLGEGVEHADTAYLIRLVGAHAKRPRRRSAADQCDEIASSLPKCAGARRLSRNLIRSACRLTGQGAWALRGQPARTPRPKPV